MFFGKKSLMDWVEQGLLTPDQQDSILRYEASKQSKSSWGLYGISFIGIATIAIGLVSLIAGNWDLIGPMIKLLGYLSLQSALGLLVYLRLPKPGIIRETSIIFFSLAFLAGIGLTGQIYHLDSNGWSALAFWCVLTLPVTLCAHKRLMPYLWTFTLLAAFSIWAFKSIEHFYFGRFDTANTAIVGFYVIFAIGMLRFGNIAMPKLLGEAFRAWSFLSLIIGSTTAGTFLWYTGRSEFLRPNSDAMFLKIVHNFYLSVWLGTAVAILAIMLSKPILQKKIALSLCAALICLAAYPTIPLYFNSGENRVLGTIYLIATWWSLAVLAIQLGWKRTFDFITLLITLRILIVYFEVFGNMMQTGIGLIVSGSVILILAGAWYKSRGHLSKWMGVA